MYPAGWERHEVRDQEGTRLGSLIVRDFPELGLRASCSVETYPDADEAPWGIPGRWRRLVISQIGDRQYPTWDAMRDLIRSCGLFDRRRDVGMVIPPDDRYVNIRETAFHWWQLEYSV